MMDKVIITLRSTPSESIEIPDAIKYKGDKEESQLKRSCFGALRIFPGIPKTISKDELEHIKKTMPNLFSRLEVKPYVESKRVDVRGASESEINKLADKEGLGHLKFPAKLKKLIERGLIKKPKKKGAVKNLTKVVKKPKAVEPQIKFKKS
jgi:hypothetical protein